MKGKNEERMNKKTLERVSKKVIGTPGSDTQAVEDFKLSIPHHLILQLINTNKGHFFIFLR